jgi:hypothetical protein
MQLQLLDYAKSKFHLLKLVNQFVTLFSRILTKVLIVSDYKLTIQLPILDRLQTSDTKVRVEGRIKVNP